jgi:hypothetical protein
MPEENLKEIDSASGLEYNRKPIDTTTEIL